MARLNFNIRTEITEIFDLIGFLLNNSFVAGVIECKTDF